MRGIRWNPWIGGNERLPLAFIAFVLSVTFTSSYGRNGLRDLADKRGLMIGAAAGTVFFSSDTNFRPKLKQEFNTLVAEYQMKFGQLQSTRGVYNWTAPEKLLAFADSNGMKLRGHCLVWHKEAGWLATTELSRDTMFAILKEYIHTVVGRYKGRIPQWDVVNEAISNNADSTYRDTFLLRRMGPEYIDSCFRWAREADPDVKLFYNEYWNEGLGVKSDKTYNLVKGMQERGVPIDGVGLQCHFRYDSLPSFDDMDTNIKRLAALGLKVAFTEVDFRVPMPATDEALQKQKEDYQGTLAVCLANSNCHTFIIWGLTDASSWVPASYPGWGGALIFDAAYHYKPAYDGLYTTLGGSLDGIIVPKQTQDAWRRQSLRDFRDGLIGFGNWDALGRH